MVDVKRQKVRVQCAKCQKPVELEMYEPVIMNSVAVSVLIVEHPAQAVCPCGFTVTIQLANVQLGMIAAPVADNAISEEVKRIIPGSLLGGM